MVFYKVIVVYTTTDVLFTENGHVYTPEDQVWVHHAHRWENLSPETPFS